MNAHPPFSDSLNAFITDWKNKPGNLIMILHKVQEEFGYISKEAAQEVSNRTGIPLAHGNQFLSEGIKKEEKMLK